MTTRSITSITDGQRKQIKRFTEDAVDRALEEMDLDKAGIQELIERGDYFQLSIVAAVKELSFLRRQYAHEEVPSMCRYLSDYQPKPIDEQIEVLESLFPDLRVGNEADFKSDKLPAGAEGWFAIPRWQKIAPTYGEAVEKVLVLINSMRNTKLCNRCEGKLGPQYLRQLAKTELMFYGLSEEQQGNDILVVPAQFGIYHSGRSVRRAGEVMSSIEFGLGAFAVGVMLLTHPERLQDYDELWIHCAGDEYAPDADGCFSFVPFFSFDDGGFEFSYGSSGNAFRYFGSASAFLPS